MGWVFGWSDYFDNNSEKSKVNRVDFCHLFYENEQ